MLSILYSLFLLWLDSFRDWFWFFLDLIHLRSNSKRKLNLQFLFLKYCSEYLENIIDVKGAKLNSNV